MSDEQKIDGFREPDPKLLVGEIIRQGPHTKSDNPTPFKSIATMTDDEITRSRSASTGIAGVVNEERLSASDRSILDDTEAAMRTPGKHRVAGVTAPANADPTGMKMSGEVDPIVIKTGFQIGDRVYHKVRQVAGEVKDVSLVSGVKVKYDTGKEGWANPKHLEKFAPRLVKKK